MGNLREVTYQGETISLQEAARQYQKVWAFNGEMMQSTAALQISNSENGSPWNSGMIRLGPTRCTCMDITFGLSEKEPFCHKKGTLI